MEFLRPGDETIRLKREQMTATMWLRVLIFSLSITLCGKLLILLTAVAKKACEHYRKQLTYQYARSLLPLALPAALLIVLGYLCSLFLILTNMNFIIEPVYAFSEFVPANPVKWSDIEYTFRSAIKSSAKFRPFKPANASTSAFMTAQSAFFRPDRHSYDIDDSLS